MPLFREKSDKLLGGAVAIILSLSAYMFNDLKVELREATKSMKSEGTVITSLVEEIKGQINDITLDVELIKFKLREDATTPTQPSTYYATYRDVQGKSQTVLLQQATFKDMKEFYEPAIEN